MAADLDSGGDAAATGCGAEEAGPAAASGTRDGGAEESAADITRDTKGFTAAIRNRIFTFLRGLVIGDYEQAIANLNSSQDPDGQPWTVARLQQALDAYHIEHERICLEPNARNVRHTYVLPAADKKTWRVQQMLVDPEEHNDWVAEFEVDLGRSREIAEPVLRLVRLGSLA